LREERENLDFDKEKDMTSERAGRETAVMEAFLKEMREEHEIRR
jgi:hypothetical protein